MRIDAKTPTSLSGVAAQARAWLGNIDGALAAAGASGQRIKSGITALASAIEAIVEAKSKAAIIVTDPTRNTAYKVETAQKLVGDSYGEALRAALDLGEAIDKARTALADAIMPSKPASVDPMAAFVASEVARSIESARSSSEAINVATRLLADALAVDDKTLMWVITSPAMQLVFKRMDVNLPMLHHRFADVLAQSEATNTNGGAALLPILSAGGSGTLRGLVDGARYTITADQAAYNGWLQASARSGAMTGIWGDAMHETR